MCYNRDSRLAIPFVRFERNITIMFYNKEMETMPRRELEKLQLEKLKKLAGTGLRCYSRCPHDKSEDEARKLVKLRPELSDALFCALRTASLIKPGMSLAGLMLSYQDFAFLNEEMKLSDGKRKIAVMSALGVPAGDGIYIEYERGGVRVIPEGGGFALSAESASGEYAAEIMELSKKRISELISEFEGK